MELKKPIKKTLREGARQMFATLSLVPQKALKTEDVISISENLSPTLVKDPLTPFHW